MSRTYSFRRKKILEEESALSEILKLYPPLKKSEEVCIQVILNITLITFDIIYTQILKEFDRFFEGQQSKHIKEKWEELIPKVFEVAKNDPSLALQDLYAHVTQCTTKGKIVVAICIIKIMICSLQSLNPYWQA